MDQNQYGTGLAKLSANRLLSFWARTAPETPMQRVGALLMALNAVFCTTVIVSVIVSASANNWTFAGLLASAFGLSVVLLLLPVGIAHGLAACFPGILKPWRQKPNGRLEEIKFHVSDTMRDLYLVVGWCVSIGAILLLLYLVALRAH